MQNLTIKLTDTPKAKPDATTIPFGTYFSDHMFLMDYVEGEGWINPRIVPYGKIELEAACMVFHYAQEIFEGMKAYRRADGKIQLFRPYENARRMINSADRLRIPQVPEDVFVDALCELIKVDSSWVPAEPDTSLYVRPFVIATDSHLGVRASHTYLFAVITCPVGSYYATGLSPVKIMIEPEDVRAVKGGTGFAKCGGNYAASIRAGDNSAALGFSQVLWLDGVHRKYIEEVGSMNVMFKIGGKIITPVLEGSVLPGVTRKSCLELIRSWGYEVEERLISIDELVEAAKSGTLEEAWGTGTAAVVSPIGEISYQGESHVVGGFKTGELTQRLYDTISGIQRGSIDDVYGWTHLVC